MISYKRYLECTLLQLRLSIDKCKGSCGYLFYEIPSNVCTYPSPHPFSTFKMGDEGGGVVDNTAFPMLLQI